MDAAMAGPFIKAFFEVLPQLGFQKVERGKLRVQPKLSSSMEVTALVGLSQKLRGNIAYAMSKTTACNFASVMMMGMPVSEMDEMAQSAISEAANMLTANAAITLEAQGLPVNISPPTLILGENVRIRTVQVQTLVVEIITEAGIIELNIGLEV